MELGKNIKVDFEGDKAIITIDLKTIIGPSKSGKTILVATTNGNVALGNGVVLGLNAYKPIA